VNDGDPLTGTWTFCADQSTVPGRLPQIWINNIRATTDDVNIDEEFVSADGEELYVKVQARLDGRDYPVSGSPFADTVAYRRIDSHTICGIAKKNKSVSLRETLVAAPQVNRLVIIYQVLRGNEELARGIAVFTRSKFPS